MEKIYAAIDLKSFYASAECVDRGLDPLTTNLVVADETRTDKTICLAVTPSLKAYGISGRPRLYEVIRAVEKLNEARFSSALALGVLPKGEHGGSRFASVSFDAQALENDPALEIGFLVAPPRMRLYEEISTEIFSIYMRYISAEDIHVYSVDECFLDLTNYLTTYHMTAYELVMTMVREVLHETGITATAGIGTNLYLAKVAMDIVAKHVPAGKDGVRVASLDEQSYRELLWCHKPITDFWSVGGGLAKRLAALGCETMGDVARLSVRNEDVLYDALGVNAELLIDHAWGWEPVQIADIKAYRPHGSSISSGQVLKEPYTAELGALIVREMAEQLALELTGKRLVTKKLTLTVGYDRASVEPMAGAKNVKSGVYRVASTGRIYTGELTRDHYGRMIPKHAHGTGNLSRATSSPQHIVDAMTRLYDRIIDRDLLIRRVNVCACDVAPEDETPAPVQLGLFGDGGESRQTQPAPGKREEKEQRLRGAEMALREKYGRNVVLKGMNLMRGGTAIERGGQIGGHRAGEDSYDAGHSGK